MLGGSPPPLDGWEWQGLGTPQTHPRLFSPEQGPGSAQPWGSGDPGGGRGLLASLPGGVPWLVVKFGLGG